MQSFLRYTKSASGFAQLPIVSKLRRISKSDGTFKIINTSPISTPTITGLDSFFMISFKDNSCPPSDLEVSNTPSVQRNRLSITTQKENATTATGSNISFTRGSPKNAIFPKRHWAVKIFLLSSRKCNNVPVRNPAPVSSGICNQCIGNYRFCNIPCISSCTADGNTAISINGQITPISRLLNP